MNFASFTSRPYSGFLAPSFPILILLIVPAWCFGQTASLQLIHNSADPALNSLDLYWNDIRIADDLNFREATAFSDIPGGVGNLAIAPAGSSSEADALQTIPLIATSGGSFTAVICGVSNPSGFRANPDSQPIGLNVQWLETKQVSDDPSRLEIATALTATDVPAVNIHTNIKGSRKVLADHAVFGSTGRYRSVRPEDYLIEVSPASLPDVTRMSGRVRLEGREGQAGLLFLSGFASPAANAGGPELELLIAFADGSVMRLTPEIFDWHIFCSDDQKVELLGIGGGTDTMTLSIPDPSSVLYLTAEVISKGSTTANSVTFWTDTEPSITNLGEDVPPLALGSHEVRAFRETFNSGSQVYAVTDDPATTTGLVVYIYRAAPDGYASKGLFQQFYLFKGTHDLVFSASASSDTRDIEIQIPISDLQDDPKKAIITATAGPVSTTVEYNDSDLGNYLRIAEITLEDVPAGVNTVELHFDSPFPSTAGAGDSYVYGAVVSYACDPVTAALRSNDGQQDRSPVIFPNPARYETEIMLPENQRVDLALVDYTGRIVRHLEWDQSPESYLLDARDLSAGTYLLRMTVNGRMQQHRMVISR